MKELAEIDIQILKELFKDGRKSFSSLTKNATNPRFGQRQGNTSQRFSGVFFRLVGSRMTDWSILKLCIILPFTKKKKIVDLCDNFPTKWLIRLWLKLQ